MQREAMIYIREESIRDGRLIKRHGPFKDEAEAAKEVERESTSTRLVIDAGE
jgi:hypothetical protein